MPKSVDQMLFRKMLLRNVTLPLLLALTSSAVFVGLVFYLINTTEWVDHTIAAIGKGRQLERKMVDAQNGLRGYVISTEGGYNEPYTKAISTAPPAFRDLREFVKDNPPQVAHIAMAQDVFERWVQYSEKVVEARRSSQKAALGLILEGSGKKLMDETLSKIGEFVAVEEGLKAARSEATSKATNLVLFVVVGFTLIVGTIIALAGRRQLIVLSENYEASLQKQIEQNNRLEEQQWIDVGRSEISQKMLGEIKVNDAANAVIDYICQYLGAQVGLLYVANEQGLFEYKAGFSVVDLEKSQQLKFKLGETVLGQAAQSNQIRKLSEVPADYLKIKTGMGDKLPHYVVAMPFRSDQNVNVVVELGFYAPMPKKSEEFLEDISASVSVAMKSVVYREKLERLYRDVQNQAEELQAQQEELRVSNEELEEQTKLLKDASTRLESQHAELEQTNSQLEEQTEELEKQKETLSIHNEQLNTAREELEDKAAELQRASQYKTEFLANMSHELRTPLNSSLILAKLLMDNKEKNLTPKQVEFAQQIMSSGNDLLNLINDILDLAKVESGKLDLHPENIRLESLVDSIERTFLPIARDRKLEFKVAIYEGLPETINTDRQRVEQIIKNLISNALKFTHEGKVEFTVQQSEIGGLQFVVQDTGIGIAKAQQDLIFEAFRQADGTDSRKYSGTGLGLSISKDLAGLLGGSINVTSEPGQGSIFTLTLPMTYNASASKIKAGVPSLREPSPARKIYNASTVGKSPVKAKKEFIPTMFPDDRNKLSPDDHLVLVVEDDIKFANILYDLAHENQFKVIVSGTADDAMDLAATYPFNAILLDMHLPDHSGLYVLDHLKQNPKTRHIPVHVISGFDFTQQAMQMGAMGYILKPVRRDELKTAFGKIEDRIRQDIKRVLIVEDDLIQREAISNLIEDTQIQVTSVGLAKDGLEKLKNESFDCLIMDLSLPDMSGFEFLDQLSQHEDYSHPPVIVYTGRDLSRDEEEKLRRHSQSLIIKGASSPDRLLNEVTLFLHKVETKLGPDRQKMLEVLRSRDKSFDSKSIMIVDDDIRNVFALTAALEQKGAQVIIARDGQEALNKLNTEARVDMVLMDIMMPVMNGYEAMREIRKQPKFLKLPVIALTAKAMKDDRDLCLNAGANDYLAKPVDMEKLVSLMRIWMSHGEGKRNG
ncbi:MAG: response regulator [Bdellovibrionaceae bacterium]|nr:response regulator [Pseudobdellovibrionaceae bacterium]